MATPAEVAASLTMEDIPVKLRCAACNKLANNAFRMPCCDQSICEDCQASLPEACPVCLHEPVKADDCRPNKALRTTIKVFLKKKGMERETARKKEMLDKVAATPAAPPTTLSEDAPPAQVIPNSSLTVANQSEDAAITNPIVRDASVSTQITGETKARVSEGDFPTEAQKDIPQASIESPSVDGPRRASTQTADDESMGQQKADEKDQHIEQQQAAEHTEQWAMNNGLGQGMNLNGIGFDGTNGGFPNMGMAGMDFSQMMQFMPNGMPNPMMGSFPNMMGMPGMGMDPMTMSSGMYGGFNGQGMGMNNMNMGMGFDAGQGALGGFNGQPSAWNTSHNKFNQNGFGVHANMGGDFGANSGYGGYNMPPHQGNFNQVHQHQYPSNDFHHGYHGQGFHGRGRGRGRGYPYAGRGRGGFGQGSQGNHANYDSYHQQTPQEVTRRGSPQYGPQDDQAQQPQENQSNEDHQQDSKGQDTIAISAENQLDKELEPGDANDVEDPAVSVPEGDGKEAPEASSQVEQKHSELPKAEPCPEKEEAKPAPIQTYVPDETLKQDAPIIESKISVAPTMMPPPNPVIPTGPAAQYAGDQGVNNSSRSRGAGRGFASTVDYRASSSGRGVGYQSHSVAPRAPSNPPVVKPIVPPAEPKGLGVEGAPKAPKALREGLPNTGIRGFSIVGRANAAAQARPDETSLIKSSSRERSRSPSRHESSHHRRHRHRSSSSSSSDERERRRERHRRHSRRYEDEDGHGHDSKASRVRDLSVESSSKRSSRRSRRDHDRDRDSERNANHSHRSHRDRSREVDRDRRSTRKRSKSPDIKINGASRRNGAVTQSASNHLEAKHAEAIPSSRKRRSDDEEHYHESKRSRRHEDFEDKEAGHRPRPSKREEKESKAHSNGSEQAQERIAEREEPKSPPKGPKLDQHALEREARNAERIARENQRRALQGGGAPSNRSRDSKANGKGAAGRRMSYKYEDELDSIETRTSRVESEREAMRYR